MPLAYGECYLDVIVLFAGLTVPERIELEPDVAIEQILEANMIAQAVRLATDVTLQRETDYDEPLHPVCGLRFRVPGKRAMVEGAFQFNADQINERKKAFLRAVILVRGLELVHGGTFVYESGDDGARRLQQYQFNAGTLSIHYDAAYFGQEHADELRTVYAHLREPYMAGAGASLGTAIERLGAASIRSSPLDMNLDLCIGAEIAFLFGMPSRIENGEITGTIRDNARAFFGDGEFFWDRDRVFEILEQSFRERGRTIGNGTADLTP